MAKQEKQQPKSCPTAQKIRIRLKAYDQRLLDRSTADIVETAKRTGAGVAGPIPIPTRREIFTVLRSPKLTANRENNLKSARTKTGRYSKPNRQDHRRPQDVDPACRRGYQNQSLSLCASWEAQALSIA